MAERDERAMRDPVRLPDSRLRSMIAGAFRYGAEQERAGHIASTEDGYARSEYHANRLVDEFIEGGHIVHAPVDPPERVSEASALLELDDHVGLHEGIEIAYLVDRYEATLTTHDGASTKATCEGETVIAALVALRRALEDTKGTDED